MTIIKNIYNQKLTSEFEIEFSKCALASIITKQKWGFLIVLFLFKIKIKILIFSYKAYWAVI